MDSSLFIRSTKPRPSPHVLKIDASQTISDLAEPSRTTCVGHGIECFSWKRLRQDLYWEQEADAVSTPAPAVAAVPIRGTRSRPHQSAADHPFAQPRLDEPLVRHLRRGTTTDALAALEAKGVAALVDALIQDRYFAAAT